MADLQVRIYDDDWVTAQIEEQQTITPSFNWIDFIKVEVASTIETINDTTGRIDIDIIDSQLTQGQLLLYNHNKTRKPNSVRILSNIGEEWNLPTEDLTDNTISISFSELLQGVALPGVWRVILDF